MLSKALDVVDERAFSGRCRASTQDLYMPAGTFIIKEPMYATEVLQHSAVHQD